MTRLGAPRSLGNTMAVAGLLPADRDSFERLRPSELEALIHPISRAA